jgi:hypothetical protein
MVKLKFLPQLKKLKAKRKSRFFKGTQKILTNGKFWAISAVPLFFYFYNRMRRAKKMRERKDNFYLGVAVYTIFSVASLIFIIFIFSGNYQIAGGDNQEKIASAAPYYDPTIASFIKSMNDVEPYIRNNIATLAGANNAGGSASIVDGVDFINLNRALIFYHENSDKYLAEVVFADPNSNVEIERFILKIKNDNDYSGGVYGAD